MLGLRNPILARRDSRPMRMVELVESETRVQGIRETHRVGRLVHGLLDEQSRRCWHLSDPPRKFERALSQIGTREHLGDHPESVCFIRCHGVTG